MPAVAAAAEAEAAIKGLCWTDHALILLWCGEGGGRDFPVACGVGR